MYIIRSETVFDVNMNSIDHYLSTSSSSLIKVLVDLFPTNHGALFVIKKKKKWYRAFSLSRAIENKIKNDSVDKVKKL